MDFLFRVLQGNYLLLFFAGFFLFGFSEKIHAKTYFSKEEALALAFENPDEAKRCPIIFDDLHRKSIEECLGEKVHQRGILAYTGKLKSSGKSGALLFDAVIGKHELVDYMIVLDHEQKIILIEIIAYRESYGGQIRNKNWRDQFYGKSQTDQPEHEKNIINISGATLSCRHVTQGVQKLLAVAKIYSKELGFKDP